MKQRASHLVKMCVIRRGSTHALYRQGGHLLKEKNMENHFENLEKVLNHVEVHSEENLTVEEILNALQQLQGKTGFDHVKACLNLELLDRGVE